MIGIVVCLFAALVGASAGLAMGGVGICAASLSVGLVGSAALVGAALSGCMSMVWRSIWWAGALAFSVPMGIGLLFAGEMPRVISILVCVLAAFVVAFAVRFPGPQGLKS